MKKLNKIPKTVLIFTMLFSILLGNGIPVNATTYQPVSLGNNPGMGADVKLGYNSAF